MVKTEKKNSIAENLPTASKFQNLSIRNLSNDIEKKAINEDIYSKKPLLNNSLTEALIFFMLNIILTLKNLIIIKKTVIYAVRKANTNPQKP